MGEAGGGDDRGASRLAQAARHIPVTTAKHRMIEPRLRRN